jgi:phosphoribosylamine-glycine ligase
MQVQETLAQAMEEHLVQSQTATDHTVAGDRDMILEMQIKEGEEEVEVEVEDTVGGEEVIVVVAVDGIKTILFFACQDNGQSCFIFPSFYVCHSFSYTVVKLSSH